MPNLLPAYRKCNACKPLLLHYIYLQIALYYLQSSNDPVRLLLGQAIAEWEKEEAMRSEALAGAFRGMPDNGEATAPAQEYVAYVPLPDQKEIEARVLAKKKADLLAKYTSESLQQEQLQSRALLTKR
jgi:hypothetical protein